MSRPLVSIVVPTYERAGFVETAIMSLLEQDYPALEVFAIDDGSRDETSAVLARIAEQSDPDRFRWWRQENAGQAAAISRGYEQAGGELLGYLSSDDYLLPGAISRLVDALSANPAADVAYSDQLIVDDFDQVNDTIELVALNFRETLRSGLCPVGVGALIRRRLYDRIGGWDPNYHFYPDYEWWLRAGDVGFVRVPEPGGAWRMHGGSISTGNFEVRNLLERLRERLLILDNTYSQELVEEIKATEPMAYSTMLIEMGLLFDRGHDSESTRRFVVEDRLGETYSHRAAEGFEKGLLWSERQRQYAEHRGTAAEYVNGQLQQTIEALRETAEERERQVTMLNAEIELLRTEVLEAAPARAALAAHEARPHWLRIARELTPQPLRARVGAALHRTRGKIRS
jgi:glycosyltransferase involved in cell wall biosynthesis